MLLLETVDTTGERREVDLLDVDASEIPVLCRR
jgi:hypothetical protein